MDPNTAIDWIPAGQRHGFDDLVFWHDKGSVPFAAMAAQIDTIVLGPHAGARFPAELRPFVAGGLTRRKQYDFSDVITAPLGRAWAAADPHVVFIESPHARVALDPNRAPPRDPQADLRAFFERLQRQRAGESVSFSGIDAIRPVTFSGEAVLVSPRDEAQWAALTGALASVRALGHDAYRSACDQVIDAILQARAPDAPLVVVGLHDTMNTKMRADGAIVIERPPADRLPTLVNFGNRGDALGNALAQPLTLPGADMRRIADAWAQAFGIGPSARAAAISLNRPYPGGYEVIHYGELLARCGRPRVGAYQVEFLREALLGPKATAHLHQPGGDWPAVDAPHLAGIVGTLVEAGRLLRA